mgnify:CR=1 FL=1
MRTQSAGERLTMSTPSATTDGAQSGERQARSCWLHTEKSQCWQSDEGRTASVHADMLAWYASARLDSSPSSVAYSSR